jgi:hypothetical protein
MRKWIAPNGLVFLAPDGHDVQAVYITKDLFKMKMCAGDAHRFLLQRGFRKE